MNKIFTLIFLLIFGLGTTAQTVIINPSGDGGFESGTTFADNGWSVTNSPTPTRNQWVCNTGAEPGFSGTKSAYLTNNAGFTVPPHKYNHSPARVTHFYRDFTINNNESFIELNFDWIGLGDGADDKLSVWLVPTEYMPVYGTAITATGSAPTGRIKLGGDYSGAASWNASPTIIIPSLYADNNSYRLVFEWSNDNSGGSELPAAVDNISLISSVLIAPPNDDCVNAINLPVSSSGCTFQTYTNLGATASVGPPDPGCANYSSGDVWFRFTVPASGRVLIDTQPDEMTDGGMAIYSGNCGNLTLIECDDNDSANGLMPFIVRTDLTPGSTIYIRVWESGNDNNGTFGICVAIPPPPPSNDDCVSAISLTVNPDQNCNVTTAGTTAYATASSQPDNVTGTPDNDVWFSFVATNTNHTISLLDIFPVVGSNANLALAVYRIGGNCNSLNLVADSDPNVLNVGGLIVGDTYLVRVYGWDPAPTSAQANFNICVGTPPPPPPNNNCNNAIPLTITPFCNYTPFTNSGATNSSPAAPGCANYSGGDVWFVVYADATGELTIDTQAGTMTNSGMAAYSGRCNNLVLLACDDNSSANGNMSSITLLNLAPGQRVYIRVWSNGGNNNGTFGICVTSPTPPGTNDAYVSCPGDTSIPMTSTVPCRGTTSLGNVLNGFLQGSNPVANQPIIFITSTDPCEFDPVQTSNYATIDFTVNVTGTYIFSLAQPSPNFDAMGYIVVNDGNFVPGSCSSGTYIAGDDDSGPSLNPQITALLTAGTPYRLITTKFSFTSSNHIGPYRWNVVGPPNDMAWYTTETGGSPIGYGLSFNPVGVAGSGLPDTNTPGIYTFYTNCPGSTLPRDSGDYIIGKIWRGIVDEDWNEPNNWLPVGRPLNTDCVYIDNTSNNPVLDYPGPPLPPNPGYAKTVTVGSNASLELAPSTHLTVTDWVNVSSTGQFMIRDDASLVQVTNTSSNLNTGNIRMQRTVSGISNVDYVYWSSPVENFNVSNVSPGTAPSLIFHWIPTIAGNGVGDYGEWQHASGNMQVGKGYIIRGLLGTTPTMPAAPQTAEFFGRPHNGNILMPIQRGSYNGSNYPGAGTSIATRHDDNWNLVGNPYPSAISANQFIGVNAANIADNFSSSIAGTVYLWRHLSAPSNGTGDPFYGDFVYNYNPNDYIRFNSTGSSPPGFNGFIASGQAFFVLMDAATPSTTANVVFNNTMRRDTYGNSQFYRLSDPEEVERHRIWLDLVLPNASATSILVGYVQGATDGVDRLYDGLELSGTSTKMYSIVDDQDFSIQGKALPFDENDTIPLGLVANQNGNLTIAINSVDGLFESAEQAIYLEDLYTGIIHDLRASTYTFYTESGTYNDRFVLRFTNETLAIDEVIATTGLTITSVNNRICVSSGTENISDIMVYDLLGRILLKYENLNVMDFQFDLSNQSNGTYIVRATLNNGVQKVKKVVH